MSITAAWGLLEETSDRTPTAQELVEVFRSIGWPRPLAASAGGRELVNLQLAGVPQALVVVVDDASGTSSEGAALGYSSESSLVVEWGPDSLRLIPSTRWEQTPGDVTIARALLQEIGDVVGVLELAAPDVVVDAENLTGAVEGTSYPILADRLGQAFAALRAEFYEAGLFKDRDVDASDRELLRIFHQLLHIRFLEDRQGAASGLPRLSQLTDEESPGPALGGILEGYASALNSQLFASGPVSAQDLPAGALQELLRTMVEPWEALRLDFSVTPSDVAGRLYQSYLQNQPTKEPSDARLFALATAVSLQAERAAYYTPTPLAERLAAATIDRWLARSRPARPADIRVVDPACGSGAFLAAAYRHLREYFESTSPRPLSRRDREELLVESIFGADIDPSATLLAEVHLLEEADLEQQRLPDLSSNLLVGDSLASPPGSVARDGAIDWSSRVATSGFDVVLMNPPFGSLLARHAGSAPAASSYIFPEVAAHRSDLAYDFLALGLRLLDATGAAGFVLPRTFLVGDSAVAARGLIGSTIAELHDYRGVTFFPAARSYVTTLVVDRVAEPHVEVAQVRDSREPGLLVLEPLADDRESAVRTTTVPRSSLEDSDSWNPFLVRWHHELSKLFGVLGEPITTPPRAVVQGTQVGDLARFTVRDSDITFRRGWAHVTNARIDPRRLPKLVRSRDIRPFEIRDQGERLFLPFSTKRFARDGIRLRADETDQLVEALGGLPEHPQPGALDRLLGPKLLLRSLAREPTVAVDLQGNWITPKGTAGALVLAFGRIARWRLDAAAALLHSSFYQWFLRGLGSPKADESVELAAGALVDLPWPALTDKNWRALRAAGAAIARVGRVRDPIARTDTYWAERRALDELTFEMLRLGSHLREVVASELVRPA